MEGSIHLLIEKENEAKARINSVILEMDQLKKKVHEDVELAVGIIRDDKEKELNNKRIESEIYMENLHRELTDELDEFEKIISSKNVDEIIEELVQIIINNKSTI